MRILHVSHYLPPNGEGGVQNFTVKLAQAQAALGNEVAVFARGARTDVQPGTTEETTRFSGIRVMESQLGPGHHHAHHRMRPLLATAFRDFVKEFRPDVVHFQHLLYHSLDYPQIAHAAGAATVLTMHDLWFTCPTVQRLDFRGELCNRAPGRTCLPCIWHGKRDAVVPRETLLRIAESPFTAPVLNLIPPNDDLIDWAAGSQECLSSVDLLVIPSRFYADKLGAYGISHPNIVVTDYGLARPADPLPTPPAPDGKLHFGVIASHRLKGGVVAVDAFRRLADVPVELLWYGSPGTIGDLPPSVQAKGTYVAADLEDVFASFDVLIVPSIWWENAPFVIREAFARGKPVIASDLGGMAESVNDGVDGLLFPVGDSVALATCIRRLHDEPGLLERLRAGVRPPKYMDEHVAELHALYADAAARQTVSTESR